MILPVTDDGVRPAGKKDECFYCGLPKGSHKEDCVCRQRTIVLRCTIEYVAEVPADWDEDVINFHRNESSWCSANGLRHMMEMVESAEEGTCNCCFRTEHEYVREATQVDHDEMGYTAWKASDGVIQ